MLATLLTVPGGFVVQVDTSAQQDAIAKYRQLKAMKLAGKNNNPKAGKQRHFGKR